MRPEKMRVQLACEELHDEVEELYPQIVTRNAHLADNMRRSAQSAVFNTAEGLAAWNPKEKLYRYEVARREVNEVRACLRLAVRRGYITWPQARRAYNLTGTIAGMLVAAARAVEEGKGRDESGKARDESGKARDESGEERADTPAKPPN